ncbi:hypothetical protein ES689_03005 [Frigoribacterium sp. ACAM 257]|uniref:hypothetical protein n=1 Tax=Frigoribacterium sp. ACAM 257 TaxID=2508998 RepID=UPI0011B9EE16|nr:hypothetical protein [Frigoribacterium sp. ACAM 257]TWX40442.1 hypothetical protein ES689_03005 [Frigoribacterium sp. ACAM 257]
MPHGPGQRRRAERTALERSVDEGFLIVRSALVVSATNHVIRRALQEALPFDEAVATEVVRDDMARLAEQQRSGAARVRRLRRQTGRAYGQSRHQFDYRTDDAGALKLREATAKALAAELTRRRDDDAFVRGVVEAARSRAWDDVGSTVVDRLGWAASPAPDYDDGRDERIRGLVEGDLADLLRAAGREDVDDSGTGAETGTGTGTDVSRG